MKNCPKCAESFSRELRVCPNDGTRLVFRDPYHLVGRTLADKYEIDELIGVGGMGAVYSAQHRGTNRRVAFKILLPHFVHTSEHLSLFTREAQTAGLIRHPHVVDITDAGKTSDGIVYLVMEWLEGQTLDDVLRVRGPLALTEAGELLQQIARALDAAHACQIVHRDLKPSNIMLVSGPEGQPTIKILDFGLAKVLDDQTAACVSAVVGTPQFASPEHYTLGGAIDHRTDIYSLGVVLFQMLTGELPFCSSSRHELARLHQTAPAPPIKAKRESIPSGIEQLILRMLAKSPADRPSSAGEVARLFSEELSTAIDAPPLRNRRHTVAEGNRRFESMTTKVEVTRRFLELNYESGSATNEARERRKAGHFGGRRPDHPRQRRGFVLHHHRPVLRKRV